MKNYNIQKKLEELSENIRTNLYWESLSHINQFDGQNLSKGDMVEWGEVAKIMELPQLLNQNTFTENNRIGFRKQYSVEIWKTKELFFEFETSLSEILMLFEKIANAKTVKEIKIFAKELMTQKLTITSEIFCGRLMWIS